MPRSKLPPTKPTNAFQSMTEEEFQGQYELKLNHLEPGAPWDGHLFETHGAEHDFVRTQDPRTIWTIQDADDGNLCICSGYHVVNRIGYLISTTPFPAETDICVSIEGPPADPEAVSLTLTNCNPSDDAYAAGLSDAVQKPHQASISLETMSAMVEAFDALKRHTGWEAIHLASDLAAPTLDTALEEAENWSTGNEVLIIYPHGGVTLRLTHKHNRQAEVEFTVTGFALGQDTHGEQS
jgi:hypothetical protein